MLFSDMMTWVPELHRRVVSVGFITAHLDPHLATWMFISLFATLLSIPLKSYEEFKKGNNFRFEDPTFFLLNSGVIFHFLSIRKQPTKMAVLTEFLTEPFRSYPANSLQQLVVRRYYRKFAISWLLMGGNLVLCVLGQCLHSLVTVLWLSDDVDLQDWPLPLGRVVLLWENEWAYWFCYFVSVSALLTCLVIHSCWFGTFMCSALLLATKLDLLALDVDSLSDRMSKTCELELKDFSSLAKYSIAREKVYSTGSKNYIKEVVEDDVRITQQVRLLDSTYRWIILVYIEIVVIATALIVTISISEWNSNTNRGFLRLDLLFACLYFAFVNNLCGQIITDKFEKLRLCLYNVNWEEQSLVFQSSLLLMLTASNRPPRLSAGSLFSLSLVSFKKVLEAVYSYISFLVTVKKVEVNLP